MKKDITRGLRQKYGGAEKLENPHFPAQPIFLPSFRRAGLPRHSRCGNGGSHRVAVSRSDLEKNSFLPFCGHSVGVNPPDRSDVRHPNWACRAVLSAVAAPAKEEAFGRRRVKPVLLVRRPGKSMQILFNE